METEHTHPLDHQGEKMKSTKTVIVLMILFISVLLTSGLSAEKQWTIMVYCCADNNLDMAGVNDLNEIELSGSDSNVNIIFLLDRWGMDDTHLYYVEHDPNGEPYGNDNNTISTKLDSLAPWMAVEEDMGNPQTLKDFLLWSLENYPAEHYLLSIWDHGSGIFKEEESFFTKGECWDDNGGNPEDYIDLLEFKNVLASAHAQLGRKIDIVGHDVCVAGQFETHYQAKDFANISIASSDNEPFDGWDYEGPFMLLKNDPMMTPETLAYHIVQYYYDWYGPETFCCNTQAACDLRVLESDFMPAFEQFCLSVMENFNSSFMQIMSARGSAARYNGPNYDLWNFAETLEADTHLPQELRDAASNLISALQLTFIHNMTGNYTDGHGCTIWFPDNGSQHGDYADYLNKIDFSETIWIQLLSVFAGEMVIATQECAEGYVNSEYEQKFSTFNGTPPYHWEKTVGQLPYGLQLVDGDTAVINGTPTYAAEFGFTLKVTDSSNPPRHASRHFYLTVNPPLPITGDPNGSGDIDVADAMYLINYLFTGGEAPDPYLTGDVDCNDTVNLLDIIYLINYIFRDGPEPCQSF